MADNEPKSLSPVPPEPNVEERLKDLSLESEAPTTSDKHENVLSEAEPSPLPKQKSNNLKGKTNDIYNYHP